MHELLSGSRRLFSHPFKNCNIDETSHNLFFYEFDDTALRLLLAGCEEKFENKCNRYYCFQTVWDFLTYWFRFALYVCQRVFWSKAPVIRERFAEIVICASVLAGVPLMFKLLNLCASVNVRLGFHVAEMLQLPRLFACAKRTLSVFCMIIRLGLLWKKCCISHDCFLSRDTVTTIHKER